MYIVRALSSPAEAATTPFAEAITTNNQYIIIYIYIYIYDNNSYIYIEQLIVYATILMSHCSTICKLWFKVSKTSSRSIALA